MWTWSARKRLDEFRDRLRAKCETAGPGEWVIGEGWDETLWPVKTLPTRWDLDEVSRQPSRFTSSAWTDISEWRTRTPCNSPVSPSPRAIPRAERSIATRTARPPAFCARKRKSWCSRRFPSRRPRSGGKRIELALADLASHGVTSAQDYSQWEDFQVYEELEREGKLTARISEWLSFR